MKKTSFYLILTVFSFIFASNALAYRDPDTGEFITKDPAGFVDGPNVYTYVKQNPWTSFDPEGLMDQDGYEYWGQQKALHPDDRSNPLNNINGKTVLISGGIGLAALTLPEDAVAAAGALVLRAGALYATNPGFRTAVNGAITFGGVYAATGDWKAAAGSALLGAGHEYATSGGGAPAPSEPEPDAPVPAPATTNEGEPVPVSTAQTTDTAPKPEASAEDEATVTATTPQKPTEPYDRQKMYGKTPTQGDRNALGAGSGQVVDHQPPLVQRYYEGDPATNEKPGYQMTPEERAASANDRNRMDVQSKDDSNSQGGSMSQYSKEKKKEYGF